MNQKPTKGYSQKGKNTAETSGMKTRLIAEEEIEKALHPTKRQNSEQ